jgi:putative endonuclease
MTYFVYVLYSESLDRYYVGYTSDIEQRIHFHNNPIESRKFTARGRPWVLKLAITLSTKVQAAQLEKFIKKMKSRKFVEQLVSDPFFREQIINKHTRLLISPEASG